MNAVAQNRSYQPITDADEARFLGLIAAGHSFASASALTRPHATGSKAGQSSWRTYFDRDPDAAERLEAAREAFRQSLLNEAIRRGVEGVSEPLSYKGELTGDHVVKKSDQILLRLLSAHFPEFAVQTVKHEHSGQIQHRHGHVVLDASRVFMLSPEQRRQLAAMLPVLSGEQEPEAIERQAAIVDVPFEEVDPSVDRELAELRELF